MTMKPENSTGKKVVTRCWPLSSGSMLPAVSACTMAMPLVSGGTGNGLPEIRFAVPLPSSLVWIDPSMTPCVVLK